MIRTFNVSQIITHDDLEIAREFPNGATAHMIGIAKTTCSANMGAEIARFYIDIKTDVLGKRVNVDVVTMSPDDFKAILRRLEMHGAPTQDLIEGEIQQDDPESGT